MQVCFLRPGINQLIRLTVHKAYKVINYLQMFEKTNKNKKNAWSTKYVLLWKRKTCRISTQCSVSIFGKALPIVTKCSVLDVAGVIKPLKHVPTWTACAENLICAHMNCVCRKSYSSAWPKITAGHCEFNTWLLYLFFKFWYQATKTQSIGDVVHELTTKEWLSSVKKWGIRLNVVLFISNALRHL